MHVKQSTSGREPHTATIQPLSSLAAYRCRPDAELGIGASQSGVGSWRSRTGRGHTSTNACRWFAHAPRRVCSAVGATGRRGYRTHHDRTRSIGGVLWRPTGRGELRRRRPVRGSAHRRHLDDRRRPGRQACRRRACRPPPGRPPHDAALEASPDRAMLAAQRAAAETLTDLERFGRPMIVVDVSQLPVGRARRGHGRVHGRARGRSGRSTAPCSSTRPPPRHRSTPACAALTNPAGRRRGRVGAIGRSVVG